MTAEFWVWALVGASVLGAVASLASGWAGTSQEAQKGWGRAFWGLLVVWAGFAFALPVQTATLFDWLV